MKRKASIAGIAAVVLFGLALPAPAQLVPDVGGLTQPLGQVIGPVEQRVDRTLRPALREVRDLVDARIDALRELVRANPDRLEELRRGEIAVRGEVIAIDPDDAAIGAAEDAGFRVISDERLDSLELRTVTLRVPDNRDLEDALEALRRLAPDTEFTANHIYWQSGNAAPGADTPATPGPPRAGVKIGIVDGGAPADMALVQKGFAGGAPAPSAHGAAVASLIVGAAGVHGAAPDAALYIADVYGTDPAGGNARAIAEALGWLAREQVPVISMSLVGPPNALLERAIRASQARGAIVVAAVGNDGPAAPPAYPASYKGVLAVTGVDAKQRALVEAGRAEHLDYAAPGADMLVAQSPGKAVTARGTSYAVPLVAARAAAHYQHRDPDVRGAALAALAAEAVDLGKRGADKTYGRGLLCGRCATNPES